MDPLCSFHNSLNVPIQYVGQNDAEDPSCIVEEVGILPSGRFKGMWCTTFNTELSGTAVVSGNLTTMAFTYRLKNFAPFYPSLVFAHGLALCVAYLWSAWNGVPGMESCVRALHLGGLVS